MCGGSELGGGVVLISGDRGVMEVEVCSSDVGRIIVNAFIVKGDFF